MSCNICLVALIGLPAAGKTSFCRWLMSNSQLPLNIQHFCYDDHLTNVSSLAQVNEFAYKLQRTQILHKIEQLVDHLKMTANADHKYLLVCDDNNYYRSMRYKLYQLCRRQQISYGQIYFSCHLEVALQRNAERGDNERVPASVLQRMSCSLEIPMPLKMKWEQNTLIVETHQNFKYENELKTFLSNCFAYIPPLVSFNEGNAQEASDVHKLDLLLRNKLKELLDNLTAGEKKATKAKELNETRKEILEIFRNTKIDNDGQLISFVDMLF